MDAYDSDVFEIIACGFTVPGQKSVAEVIFLSEISNHDVYPWFGIKSESLSMLFDK